MKPTKKSDLGAATRAVHAGEHLSPPARRLLDRRTVFQIIPSLGGVESGAIIPAPTSHRGLSPDERMEAGISDGLVRLSLGIEDPSDLEADLAAGLDGIAP